LAQKVLNFQHNKGQSIYFKYILFLAMRALQGNNKTQQVYKTWRMRNHKSYIFITFNSF